MLNEPSPQPPAVAYFCAEYALGDELPTYAGGLGVLAGDVWAEAEARALPMTFLGLAYRHNVAVKTEVNRPIGDQLRSHGFALVTGADGRVQTVTVEFGTWSVTLQAWRKGAGPASILLLDADLDANSPINRNLTATLYDPDLRTRLLQQLILADAGCQFLAVLGVQPAVYHLNEGHMAFVLVVLAARYVQAHPGTDLATALTAVGAQVVATKHTILSGAGDFADLPTITQLFDGYLHRWNLRAQDLFAAGAKEYDPNSFSTTRLLLKYARSVNGVSALHCEAERIAHPHSRLIPITNGVYPPHWQRSNLAQQPPDLDDAKLWELHRVNKIALTAAINKSLGSNLSNDILTLVWARRFASYKRPTLIFSDGERLKRLMNDPDRPLQVVISGNANESDVEGHRVYEEIVRHSQSRDFAGRLVFLPHYVTATTRALAGGADVWLNTPIRGMEACGTSGMKAGLNGALHLSTADGWIDEVDIGSIGWELPADNSAASLYDLLEHQVAPQYYLRNTAGVPVEWVQKLRTSITIVEQHYTTKRMLDDYYAKLYLGTRN